MRAPSRPRRLGPLLLATGGLLLLGLLGFGLGARRASTSRAASNAATNAASSTTDAPRSGGAASEFQRTRREQALIRAEETAELLRVLDRAPTLGRGGS